MKIELTVAVLGLVSLAQAELVTWEFPRTGNCHEGIPFSDGKTGVLVWGGGDTVNLTLGRGDLWDHRGGYAWTAEQNYTNVIAAVRTRDNAKLNALFANEAPENWGGRYNPYMLPLGRIVLKVPGRTLKSGTLDPMTGLGKILFSEGDSMELAMSTVRGVFAFRVPEGVAYELRSVPSTDAPVYEKTLKARGFERASVFDAEVLGTGGFRWRLPADAAVWVSWRMDGRVFALRTGRGEKTSDEYPSFDSVAADAVAYWTRFWAEGARVRVPDELLQRQFEYGMYRFGAMTDPDGVAAGLQGPWLEDDQLVPWCGDYHFNINVQECYSPAYRGGHFRHLMPLFRMVLGWRERLRDNARKFVGIADGYTLPHSVDDRGVCIGGFWTGTIDHASTAWVADMMFRYVRYSRDISFLKDGAYDFMKGAMNVYRAMMEERDGRLSIPLAPSPEWGASDVRKAVGRNSSFQLAAAHRLVKDLIAAAEFLGEAPDPMWTDVATRLPKYTADETGLCLFEGQRFVESHRHHSHLAALFPFDTLDLSDREIRGVVDRSYRTWVARGTGQWTGWCVPWAAILNAHLDMPERAVALLHDWDTYFCDEGHGSHHNAVRSGFTTRDCGRGVMQMDGQCGAASAVMEFLVHETNGKVEFFKGCPAVWKEVSFENIALSDGRRVSGSRIDGKVTLRYE